VRPQQPFHYIISRLFGSSVSRCSLEVRCVVGSGLEASLLKQLYNMGKHNGKSRNTGMKIGASLVAASKQVCFLGSVGKCSVASSNSSGGALGCADVNCSTRRCAHLSPRPVNRLYLLQNQRSHQHNEAAGHRHTTLATEAMQSVVAENALSELMRMVRPPLCHEYLNNCILQIGCIVAVLAEDTCGM
jgi:hypothetical protein